MLRGTIDGLIRAKGPVAPSAGAWRRTDYRQLLVFDEALVLASVGVGLFGANVLAVKGAVALRQLRRRRLAAVAISASAFSETCRRTLLLPVASIERVQVIQPTSGSYVLLRIRLCEETVYDYLVPSRRVSTSVLVPLLGDGLLDDRLELSGLRS